MENSLKFVAKGPLVNKEAMEWAPGTRKWNLRVNDHQINCSELIYRQRISIKVQLAATWWHDLFYIFICPFTCTTLLSFLFYSLTLVTVVFISLSLLHIIEFTLWSESRNDVFCCSLVIIYLIHIFMIISLALEKSNVLILTKMGKDIEWIHQEIILHRYVLE